MSAKPGEKWAVLIGIDSYPEGTTKRFDTKGKLIYYENLRGCVEDILQVEQYLLGTMKVQKSHITKLLAARLNGDLALKLQDETVDPPTYNNIVHTLKSVTECAKSGDMIYIHYSGHGARATSVFPGLKGESGLDEVFVPTDIACGGQYLRDLEMALFLRKMVNKGLVVTVVLDCCHSGSATRGSGRATTRGVVEIYKSDLPGDLPPSFREIVESSSPIVNVGNSGSVIRESWLLEPQGYTLFAACRPHERAREYDLEDGRCHGALTYWLLDTLRHSPAAAISSQMLYRRACARIKNEFVDQTPILAGESDRLFFGTDYIPSVYTITVRDVNQKPNVGEQLELAGGRLHGIRVGSEYAVFPFMARGSDPGRMGPSLARIEVKEVSPLKSIATLIELNDADNREVEPGCQAVLLTLPLEEKILIEFFSPKAAAVEEFRGDWDKHAGHKSWLHLASSDEKRRPSFLIAVNDKEEYEIQDGNGVPLQNVVPPLLPLRVGDATSMLKLTHRLRHLAQFNMVKMLENHDVTSALRNQFLFEVLGRRKNSKGEPSSLECERLIENGGMFDVQDGDSLVLRFKNKSPKPVNFVLFNLQPLFGIAQVYPGLADFECLDAGDERLVPINMSIPPILLRSTATTPIEDILKVFVTIDPTAFQTLELPDIDKAEMKGFRGGARSTNALQEFLGRLPRPLRNAKSAAQAIDEWQTMDIKIRTSRKSFIH